MHKSTVLAVVDLQAPNLPDITMETRRMLLAWLLAGALIAVLLWR